MSFFCGYLSDNFTEMLQKGPAPHFSEVMNSRQMCPVTGSYSITLSDQPWLSPWVSPLPRSAQAVSLPPPTHSSLTRAKWSTEDATALHTAVSHMENTRGALRGLTIQHYHPGHPNSTIITFACDTMTDSAYRDFEIGKQRRSSANLAISASVVPTFKFLGTFISGGLTWTPSAGPTMFSGKCYRPLRPRTNRLGHHSDPQDALSDSDHNQEQYSNYWKIHRVILHHQ